MHPEDDPRQIRNELRSQRFPNRRIPPLLSTKSDEDRHNITVSSKVCSSRRRSKSVEVTELSALFETTEEEEKEEKEREETMHNVELKQSDSQIARAARAR